MTYNKEICKNLAAREAKVLVKDGYNEDGTPNIVKRTVVRAFGLKKGRSSYWGVDFSEPLSDGSTGVTFQYIVDVVKENEPPVTINLHSLIEKVEITNQNNSQESIDEIEKKLIEVFLKVLNSCSNSSDTEASQKHKEVAAKHVKISEFTELNINLKNASKAELMKCFENELSEFETTQVFENVRIWGHVSVAGK
jgi:hypothetical protein